jgi:hypothetical protein
MRRRSLFQINYSSKNFLIGYVIIVLMLILILFLYYTNAIVKRLERDSEMMTLSLAELAAYLPSIDDYRLSLMANQIVRNMMRTNKLSFIITDKLTGQPIIARGIDPELERKIQNDEPLTPQEITEVAEILSKMDGLHQKISTRYVMEDRAIVGYMYYGDVSADKADRLPFVFTDVNGNPLFWRIWRGFKTAQEAPQEVARAKAFVRDAQEHDRAVTVQINPGYREGYFHYSIGRYNELLMMPFLQTILITGFLGVGFWMYRRSKQTEQAAVWGGLARETAHQLGTPISSLMGWAEMLEERIRGDDKLREILDEMEEDIERLSKITARFGEIGSTPKLEPMKVSDVIHQAVEYYRKRTSLRRRKIEIMENYDPQAPLAMINGVLMGWVIENLIKNSLDAFDKEVGVIRITTRHDPKRNQIVIIYSDNGRGIPRKARSKIFQPGYTTKKHGWGLGLALAKRIVEEYHGGKLLLVETSPEGTTFHIRLPASEN